MAVTDLLGNRHFANELTARRQEVERTEEEGIEFCLLCNPTEILGYNNPHDARDSKNGFVTGITCVKMGLAEPDECGRRCPVVVEVNRLGSIVVNKNGSTSRNAVYTGGDAVTATASVISAMGVGKTSAKVIDEYLSK